MILMAYPVFASDSPAYKQLLEENPVYVKNVTVDEMIAFYKDATVEEILDLKENNFTKGDVTVGGLPTECYVYMRTFSITDISNYTVDEAKHLADRMFAEIKSSLSSKYIKCIARSYSINISGVPDKQTHTYKTFTVKFLIATGESNEERKDVIASFVRPTLSEWEGLSEGEKFIKLNEFILNGQFSYDMTYFNRSSVYAFINGKKGVCEEYAGLTSLFLDEMGYKNHMITGTIDGVMHIWNVVYINERPYHLDILHNGPTDENGIHTEITDEYLLVCTERIMQNRIPGDNFADVCEKAVYNYIFEGAPSEIPTGELYTENGILYEIPLFSTVSHIRSLLSLDGEFFKFTGVNGEELTDSQTVGSGCVLSLQVNGAQISSLVIHVEGDVDGDGSITDGDTEVIKSIILRENVEFSDAVLDFCDINGDGTVSISDFIRFSKLKDSINTYHG